MGERFDPRPVGVALASWASAWAATSGDARWWLAAAGACVALAVLARLRRSRAAAALLLIALAALGSGVLRVTQLADSTVARLASEGAIVEVDAELRGAPRVFAATATRPEAWVMPATVLAVAGRGEAWATRVPVELRASGAEVVAWSTLPPGSVVRVAVRLSVADPDAGLAALARARGRPVLIAGPGPVDAAVERVRAGLRAASADLSPDARALVPALAIGDTSQLPADTVAQFKTTGLTHLTAVSGANLVLLLGFVRAVAIGLGVRGRRLVAVSAVTVWVFVVLCLAEPSVVRAAAMGLVALAALGSGGRGRQGLRYLCVAVLVLVWWDPWISRSLGFVLSVAASAGLLMWASRWADVLARWAPRWLAEAVAVPLAAQLATQPIVTAISGQVSLVGLLANAVAGPLVGPATVFGFAAAGVSVVWLPLAKALAWVAGWCAQGLCWIAGLGDALPGAAAPVPAGWPVVVLVAVGCVLVARLVPLVLARRWLSLGVAVLLVAALSRTPTPPGWPPPSWTVVSCDVGQGDATLIRAGPGQAVLVDAGPDPTLLRRCLDQLGVSSVPLALMTHLHADHVTGLSALAGRGVRTVVTSGLRTPASGAAIVDALVATGVEHVAAEAGSSWTVGEARVEVLAADEVVGIGLAEEGESSGENDASLLLRVTAGGLTVLLAGDTEDTGQQRRMAVQDLVDVDVLLVPHHGSSRQWPSFLAATTPEVALISVGAKNDYGHPTAKTLKLVGGLTPNIVRTDQHGSVAVARVDGRLVVTTQR